mmetsp:Transcript_34879/g.110184  ORF Transcript_34879/g.110184 Transcript_34879/m.110184 type:complete len:103 (+) Transcript_34879:50-358(+)
MGDAAAGAAATEPLSLLELSFSTVLENVQHVASFGHLPEEICCGLFEATLARGKLTEPILDVFVLTGHERLLERIRQLDIKPLPPIIGSTRKLWLGDKPSLY